jgi:uncharacterized protein YtpQ (UPF0354 family)
MPRYEHPMQLFALDFPEQWQADYQEETGGVIFVNADPECPGALSITPMALTGAEANLDTEVLEAAERLDLPMSADQLRRESRGELQLVYGEGDRDQDLLGGTLLRLWAVRRGRLLLRVIQLGASASDEAQRLEADLAVRSLEFAEVMPPTPEEFRARVLEVVAREYPTVRAEPSGALSIDLSDAEGRPLGTMGLENLYRSCLLESQTAGAQIREHLDKLLETVEEAVVLEQFDTVRDKLLPMLKSDGWAEGLARGADLVNVEFAPGLRIYYVVDHPGGMVFVTQETLRSWNVPLEQVEGLAQDNLARRSPDQMVGLPGPDGKPAALVVNERDGYDATRLVLPSVREAFAEVLGDEYLVGVPNRDFLIAFSPQHEEMAGTIIRQIRHDYQRMAHPISAGIYRVLPDRVELSDL